MNTEISMVHHGGIRESLKEGTITKQQLIAALPFHHYAVKVSMTGKELKSILEQQWALKAENLLQTEGITYSINRNAPAGERISDLKTAQGELIQDNRTYTAATSNYLASGGDGFKEFKQTEWIKKGPELSELLSVYLNDNQ
ncbi:5'-nucleotidase C-terminal domain-containing protein [Bacillus sp. OVS6]|nr:5'-nucleotidase C-terminal domain-containing protein [Bacillus sp. OVS6]